MPTYEYKCETCNHQFEVFARMSDPDPETCAECGAATIVKVLFPVAVHYKGSGFYSTDYKGSKRSAETTSGSDSSTKSEGSSSSFGTSGDASSSSSSAPSSDS